MDHGGFEPVAQNRTQGQADEWTAIQVPQLVIGGILLGGWIYFAFSGSQSSALGWLGLVIAGGFYGSRFVNPLYKAIIITVISISFGLLIFATFQTDFEGIMSVILATIGATLIASGMPVRVQPNQARSAHQASYGQPPAY